MQPIRQHSLFEEYEPVLYGILIVEVRAQGELLVQLNHRPVGNHTRTRPQPLMQNLHNIPEPGRDIVPLDALLVQKVVDPVPDSRAHPLEDKVEPVFDRHLEPSDQVRPHNYDSYLSLTS